MSETCKWYVSIEVPECGRPATQTVRVNTKIIKATLPVCDLHKIVSDDNFARARNASKIRS